MENGALRVVDTKDKNNMLVLVQESMMACSAGYTT